MSYFDRPERRAEWDKELAALKREKEARRSGTFVPKADTSPEAARERAADAPSRIRISYAQLLQEESMAKAAVTTRSQQKEKKKEVQLER